MTLIDAARRGLPGSNSLEPLLVSKIDSARVLSVSLRTVTNLIARKELPCRRIGKRTLIPYKALVRFAQRDHLRPNAAEPKAVR